jgi:hypothetical protein
MINARVIIRIRDKKISNKPMNRMVGSFILLTKSNNIISAMGFTLSKQMPLYMVEPPAFFYNPIQRPDIPRVGYLVISFILRDVFPYLIHRYIPI